MEVADADAFWNLHFGGFNADLFLILLFCGLLILMRFGRWNLQVLMHLGSWILGLLMPLHLGDSILEFADADAF